jgi:hypothetical protein
LNQLDPYLDGTHPNERASIDMGAAMIQACQAGNNSIRSVPKSAPKLSIQGNFWEHSPAVLEINNVAGSPAPLIMGRLGGVDKFRVAADGSLVIDCASTPVINAICRGTPKTPRMRLDDQSGSNNVGFDLATGGTSRWIAPAVYSTDGNVSFGMVFYNNQPIVVGDRNTIFTHGGNNRVGFGTTTPAGRLDIENTENTPTVVLRIPTASSPDFLRAYQGGALLAQIWSNGTFNSATGYFVQGTQVVGRRDGGWNTTPITMAAGTSPANSAVSSVGVPGVKNMCGTFSFGTTYNNVAMAAAFNYLAARYNAIYGLIRAHGLIN